MAAKLEKPGRSNTPGFNEVDPYGARMKPTPRRTGKAALKPKNTKPEGGNRRLKSAPTPTKQVRRK